METTVERTIASDKTWSLGANFVASIERCHKLNRTVYEGESELIAETVNDSIAIQ